MHSRLPADTTPEVFALQVEHWKSMTHAEKGELVDLLSLEVDAIARAGIRFREPNISPSREHWLIISRRYGRTFAEAAVGPEPARSL